MKITDNSKQFMQEFDHKALAAFEQATGVVRKNCSRQAPVLTGALRDSIISDIVAEFHAQIGSELDYASIVEARTGFLVRGLMMSLDEVKQIFENAGFTVRIR